MATSLDQTITLTTFSSVDTTSATAFTRVNATPGRLGRQGAAQFVRVFCSTDNNGGANTIRFILRDASRCYGAFDATVTSTTVRQALAGASGNYLNSVVFSESGTSVLDLTGHGIVSQQALQDGEVYWVVGLPSGAVGGTASVRLDLRFGYDV